jgi:hypothetical protein
MDVTMRQRVKARGRSVRGGSVTDLDITQNFYSIIPS